MEAKLPANYVSLARKSTYSMLKKKFCSHLNARAYVYWNEKRKWLIPQFPMHATFMSWKSVKTNLYYQYLPLSCCTYHIYGFRTFEFEWLKWTLNSKEVNLHVKFCITIDLFICLFLFCIEIKYIFHIIQQPIVDNLIVFIIFCSYTFRWRII